METYDSPFECSECGVQTDTHFTVEEWKQLCARCFEDSQYEDDLFHPRPDLIVLPHSAQLVMAMGKFYPMSG